MLTKNIIKEIRSLDQRKARREQGCWLAEGNKMVGDLLLSGAFQCLRLVALPEWWTAHPTFSHAAEECYEVTRSEMDRLSLLQTPQDVLAVFALPDWSSAPVFCDKSQKTKLLLDEIQDPGNLGTIIRTADWFGVRDIYCAPGTSDCFSPKVVQATMSALARVRLHYFSSKSDECAWLSAQKCPVYGTFLEGQDIYQTSLDSDCVLVMGNEGRGVSPEIASLVSHKLLIPDFSPDGHHVESLNVSVATAICLSEIKARSRRYTS